MSALNEFFKKCVGNSDYDQAKEALCKIEEKIDKISMDFIDISSFDFELKKNEWKSLPEDVSLGVQIMGIHIGDDYRSVLVHYDTNSYIAPHQHPNEYKVLKVIEGSVRNITTDEVYERGDVVIIPKDKVHHIITEDEEAYLYVLYTEYSEYLKLPHNEEQMVMMEISHVRKTS